MRTTQTTPRKDRTTSDARLTRQGKLSLLAFLSTMCIASCVESAPELSERAPRPNPSPSETSFVNGGKCPSAEDAMSDPNAGCLSTATWGDMVFSVYARLDKKDRPRSWQMQVTEPGGTLIQGLPAGNPYSYPRAVGATDIDGDGQPEWWVKVMDFTSHGAPWSRLNLFVMAQDALSPITYDAEPLSVNVGGIARLGEGAVCRKDRLVLLRAEAQNVRNTRWRVVERSFEIAGRSARFLKRTESTLVIDDYNDPDLDPYYLVDCEGIP